MRALIYGTKGILFLPNPCFFLFFLFLIALKKKEERKKEFEE